MSLWMLISICLCRFIAFKYCQNVVIHRVLHSLKGFLDIQILMFVRNKKSIRITKMSDNSQFTQWIVKMWRFPSRYVITVILFFSFSDIRINCNKKRQVIIWILRLSHAVIISTLLIVLSSSTKLTHDISDYIE